MLRFANAKAADLDTINALIATAIGTWPVSARLKRLAALPLRYNWADFQDFEMFFGPITDQNLQNLTKSVEQV